MANGFSVTITAVDNASKQINALNRKIADMRGPVDRVQKSLSRFADLTGISKLNSGMHKLAASSLDTFRSVGRIVEPLAAITGAASVAGMMRLVSVWSQMGVASANTARRLGVSIGQLQSLQGAATLSGASADALTSGMENLGQTLYDAVGGRAPEAVVMLNTLGISFQDVAGHARNVSDVLPQLADRIAAMSNPYDQLRAATALLGGSAKELLPFLQRGSAGIAEYNELAQRYGVMNERGAAAARQMQLAQAKLTLATRGLGNSIAEALAPTLGPLMTDLAEWIAANRELISTDVGGFVHDLGEDLRQIDWKGDVKEIKQLWSQVNDTVQVFGGWEAVIKAIIALKLLGWVTNLIAPLTVLVGLFGSLPSLGVITSYLGIKGAVKSGNNLGKAAELGLTPSAMPGSVDEYGNVKTYVDPAGKMYTPDDVETMYANKHPEGMPAAPGDGILGKVGRMLGIGGSGASANPTASDSAYKPLLDLVGRTEGTDRGRGYDETLGYGKYTGGNVDLQHMTLSQVDALQQRMLDNGASSTAVGRYQIIRKTLQGLEAQEHLDPNTTMFSQALQDHLAATLARRRGGDDYLAGRLPAGQFQTNLSQEWASLPKPGTGTSYYPGQRAGASDADVQGVLGGMRADAPANINGGSGASPADVTHTVNGQASVQVHLGGYIPSGTTVGASTSGDLFQGAPKIYRSMADAG